MDLHEACENGNEERVVELLLADNSDAQLKQVDAAGRSPLHAACIGGQLTVVQLLLGRRCLVFFPGRSIDAVRLLLENVGKMKDVDVRMKRKEEGLAPAALVQLPSAATVQAADLIDGRVYVDHYGNAPIQCVACFGCGTEVKHILEGLEITRELLLSGCHANTTKTSNHWTPLHWSCFNGNHEMTSLLLRPSSALTVKLAPQQFAIPLVQSQEGLFPVDLAGRLALKLGGEMHRLRQGSDTLGADDSDDASHAFEYRTWRLRLDHVRVVQVLVADFIYMAPRPHEYAAICNVRSQPSHAAKRTLAMFTASDVLRYGQHLLFWCAGLNLLDDVQLLLSLRFQDVPASCLNPLFTVRMDDGRLHSALHVACAMGFAEMVQCLLSHLASVGHALTTTVKTAHGKRVAPANDGASMRLASLRGWTNDRLETPLFVAVVHNHVSVVQVFLDNLSSDERAAQVRIANVEGATPQHVATESVRQLLGLPIRSIFRFEYVLIFDRTHASFRKTLVDVLAEESSRAPSAVVTPAGTHRDGKTVHDVITVGAMELVIAERAEEMHLKLRKRGSLLREPFEMKAKHGFEPFISLHRQQVVLNIIRNNVNVARHVRTHTIRDIFPLHDSRGCRVIHERWLAPSRPRLSVTLTEFVTEGRGHNYSALWAILTYFGEKPALYTGWMMFYTAWLLAIAPLCLLIQLLSLVGYESGVLYLAIIVSLWTTLMVERWKRKRSELLCNWGLPQTSDTSGVSAEYHGDFVVDMRTNEMDVRFPSTLQHLRVALGTPALLVMGAIAILAFVLSRLANNVDAWKPYALGISSLYAILMLVLDWAYTHVAYMLTRWENHRTVCGYEAMLAMKLFWFKFLNAFISLFALAFVDQDFSALRMQLLTILVVRQLKNLGVNYVLPLLHVRYLWRRHGYVQATDFFTYTNPEDNGAIPTPDAIDANESEDEKTVPSGIAMQALMYPSDLLLNKQIDLMMQFGYITMFVTVFPAGPFLAAINNVLEVHLDVRCSLEAKRRPFYDCDVEVTTFMSILEFMSFAAVTVNCGLLFLGTDLDVYIAAYWAPSTLLKKVAIILVLEHFLLGLKATLVLMISDMPSWVDQYYTDLDRSDASLDASIATASRDLLASTPSTVRDATDIDDRASSASSSTTTQSTQTTTVLPPIERAKSPLHASTKCLHSDVATTVVLPLREPLQLAAPTVSLDDASHVCAVCEVVAMTPSPAIVKCIECKIELCATCDRVLHQRQLPGLPGTHVRVPLSDQAPGDEFTRRLLDVQQALAMPTVDSASMAPTTTETSVASRRFRGHPDVLQTYWANKAQDTS
ncbi:hypothetical protein SDRG_00099 [Saprolegnia diclina VS20]|uniref:Anoctamin transmembrane domain-containing protein n=1 Tax=Saprolegnia diclina (strain VS20) TaxID=1156394 RepID=T0R5Z3_SAPDV|nr:hypothetical protein SDRG_00099 [Saprolegnia diclina VS20]EQC42361.1 hypothetical protein SDRG_00099 [Saprolegnia diclina VS20]|eukprot:XP_008603784.1 hypothetical protein SDRG_00099 [Saprolegnia diclina VS20]